MKKAILLATVALYVVLGVTFLLVANDPLGKTIGVTCLFGSVCGLGRVL